ncbi:MAG: VOC family protein [Legionella sp.]|nr:VOC family protein [Legionella sp.]
MNNIEKIIGDYQLFFSDILHRIRTLQINIIGMPLSHFLLRTATLTDYAKITKALEKYCCEVVETGSNDKRISILTLTTPLSLEQGFELPVIEIPAPSPSKDALTGFESMGIVAGPQFQEFLEQHDSVFTAVKEYGPYLKAALITFDNQKTVKFYNRSIREVIRLESGA